jgi:hypothetical protein
VFDGADCRSRVGEEEVVGFVVSFVSLLYSVAVEGDCAYSTPNALSGPWSRLHIHDVTAVRCFLRMMRSKWMLSTIACRAAKAAGGSSCLAQANFSQGHQLLRNIRLTTPDLYLHLATNEDFL